jgi:FixJ family two-component response regulator
MFTAAPVGRTPVEPESTDVRPWSGRAMRTRHGLRILVADDDALFLDTTAALLTEAGYDVDVVDSGEGVLARVREAPYALLIADVRMPGNEGLALVGLLAEQAPTLPVVLVSGHPSLDVALSAIGTRVSALLVKPFAGNALLLAVEHALERARALRVIGEASQRVDDWRVRAQDVASVIARDPALLEQSVDAFVQGTLEQIMRGVLDIAHLTDALSRRRRVHSACALLHCPRHATLTEELTHAIAVLEGTRTAFKSPQLHALRLRLEAVLANDRGRPPGTG